MLDGIAATGRTMGVCVVGAVGRRWTVVCCSGSNRKGEVGDYKAVSQKVVEVSRQWSKECGRWEAESVVGR